MSHQLTIYECDLLDANVAAICHQVNCKGVMGAGIAKAIAYKHPEVKEEYTRLCNQKAKNNDERSLLGTIQIVIPRNTSRAVINVFGQFDYGRNGLHTNYDALARCFDEINMSLAGKSVAFPYGFGCGLGGGDWSTVEKLMIKHLWACDVDICIKPE